MTPTKKLVGTGADRAISIHRQNVDMKLALLGAAPRRKEPLRPTPERPMYVSASEIGDFIRCRVLHNWRTYAQLQPNARSEALAVGTLGHDVLERWYKLPKSRRTIKAMQQVARVACKETTEKSLTLEHLHLVSAMTAGYAQWVLDKNNEYSDAAIGLEACAPEEWFDLPITKDGSIRVRGKIDLRFRPTTLKRSMALLESKFLSSIRSNGIERRVQLTIYLWALRCKFPEVKRFIAYPQILRKQMPGPRVKADLFYREPIERTDEEIEQWIKDTRRVCEDMLDGAVYPNVQDSCEYLCEFKHACQLRGNAADLRHVLKTEFTTRERR